MTKVAVVGGGITGLSCAHYLAERGLDPVVYEEADRPGGKLLTGSIAGVPVEMGADSFLPRDELPIELCHAVGLGPDLIAPRVFGAYIWLNGALRKLPAGSPFGIPVRPWAAYRAGLLSARGALRAQAELLTSGPLRGPDVSIGAFLRRRFGDEVVDNLVEPLLGGTRAGTADDISLAAGAKEIDVLARGHRSLRRALARAGTEVGAGSTGFVSIQGGLSRLIEALASRVQVRTGTSVNRIEGLDVEGVVLTVPAFRAAPIVGSIAPAAAEGLGTFEYQSSASVTLVYPPDTFEFPEDGSGALLPRRAGLTITGCTWYSHKWFESRPADGSQIVRSFVSAAHEPDLPGDDRLTAGAAADVSTILGQAVQPKEAVIVRWARGHPQYAVGHLERVAQIEAALPPSVVLAGAGYRGAGIPDCISSAQRAATRLAEWLEAR